VRGAGDASALAGSGIPVVAPLGALSQAWVSAEASLPLGWQIRGLWRFDDLWIALGEGDGLAALEDPQVPEAGVSAPQTAKSCTV
jgi:hypothetical protein